MRQLVLASTSRYRRELLDRLGRPYEVAAPPFDEEAARAADPTLTPEAMARAFAVGKARSLVASHPDALILGADQVPALGDHVLHKPGTSDAARAQLGMLAGRTHQLFTAVALVDARTGAVHERLDVHEMTMWPLGDEEITTYVERDQPLDCAGSYRVEAGGVALFSSMRGEDWTGIVGLPLTKVVALLREHRDADRRGA
jgi:septum formation protein